MCCSTLAILQKGFASSALRPIVNPPIKYTEVIKASSNVFHAFIHLVFMIFIPRRYSRGIMKKSADSADGKATVVDDMLGNQSGGIL